MKDSIDDSKKQNYVNKSLTNTLITIVASLSTKVVNLGFNILLTRRISKEAFGIAKIYLEFAFLLVIFFPRETIRKTAQKFCPDSLEAIENKKYEMSVQLNWILNFAFNFISLIVFFVFIFFGSENLKDVKIHLFLYILSANLELVGEPIIIYMNVKIINKEKLKAITFSNYVRIISNYLLCLIFGLDLWSFTLSRLLASTFYLIYLIKIALKDLKLNLKVLYPNFKIIFNFFDNKNLDKENNKLLKEIFSSFIKTNILKMILAYTEKIVLSFFLILPENEKAEYSFVTDNFAIIIRYGLEPTEEMVYNLSSKLENSKENKNNLNNSINDNNKTEKLDNYGFNILKGFLKGMFIFGTLLVLYISIVGKEAIALVFTERWATESAISILKTYSIYVAIISINGVLEAYSGATSTNEEMDKYNTFMVFNSLLLIILSYLFSKNNVKGLIYANLITMVVRIILNLALLLNKENKYKYNIKSIIINIFNFLKNSNMRKGTFISIVLSVLTANSIKNAGPNSNNFYCVAICGLFFILNLGIVYKLERKSFKDLFIETKKSD